MICFKIVNQIYFTDASTDVEIINETVKDANLLKSKQ